MDSIIAINKPQNITSHDAVTKAKRILKVKKAGHTGTLDPLATGLLLICTNRATRLASYFSDLDKEYRAVMKLGETTDTQDAEGKIINRTDSIDLSRELIHTAINSFQGEILQQPPMYSAIKHKGKPLYKLARKGIEIERKERAATIYEIALLNIALPSVTFRTRCSKGTYIRTLCDDIGKKLGTGAHMSELERTAIGRFRIEDSITLDELRSLNQSNPEGKGIYTMNDAMSWMPELIIDKSLLFGVKNGSPVPVDKCRGFSDEFIKAEGIRVKSPGGELLAIGSYSEAKKVIKMKMVFN